jgi:hypothetical protein
VQVVSRYCHAYVVPQAARVAQSICGDFKTIKSSLHINASIAFLAIRNLALPCPLSNPSIEWQHKFHASHSSVSKTSGLRTTIPVFRLFSQKLSVFFFFLVDRHLTSQLTVSQPIPPYKEYCCCYMISYGNRLRYLTLLGLWGTGRKTVS